MKTLKRFAKIWLISLASILVVGGGTYYVLAKMSELPASMNMGSMDGMMMGHEHMAMTMNSPHPEIPMSSLKEKASDAPVKTFEIQTEAKVMDTGSGKTIDAWTYNGTVPGPEIRVQQGDRVVVHLKNRLSEGVTIHWHGVELPNAEDGVAGLTQDAVPLGGEYTYNFIAKKPGTYWYHSHQFSDNQTTKGLYGTLIVEPKSTLITYDKDYTAVLHNWPDNIFTVNNTSDGEHFDAKPGELVRLRIVNTASDTHMTTLIGTPFQVVAIDGYDLHEPTPLDGVLLPIAASQRYDLIFKMPESGTVQMVNVDKPGFQGNFFTKLLGLKTLSAEAENQMLTATIGKSAAQADLSILSSNPVFDFATYGTPVQTQDHLSIDTTFDHQYEMKLGNSLGFFNGGFTMRFKINEATFPNIPSYSVKEGDRTKIHIENNTDIPHPMHLHGHFFRVLSKNGVPLSGSPVYLSTLLVGKQETYDIAFLADNPGLWMLHCHNLGHASNGMDMMINYEGVTTPYAVGKKTGNHPD